MANDDKSKVSKLTESLKNVCSKMASPGNPMLFRMSLRWMAAAYMPFIPLTDGGRSRGRLVGLLQQFSIRLDEKVVRDKTQVAGDFVEADYSEGVKEGRMISAQKARVEIPILFDSSKQANKLKMLKDKTAIALELVNLIKSMMPGGK